MKNILFLLSHQPNPRFVKQIKFLEKYNNISVVYYSRDYLKDLSPEYASLSDNNLSLGTITNGNYLFRSIKYIISIGKLYGFLRKNTFDIIILNNIDVLFLFKLCMLGQKCKTEIIVEISDLRSHTYANSFKSNCMRFFENRLFTFVDKLIVTSPKFYELYYKNIFLKEYFLLENKPLSSMIPSKLVKKTNSNKTIIGIVGLLLQGNPYRTLFEAIGNDIRYEVHVYGKGPYSKLVEEFSVSNSNIKYFGEYNFFKDSAKIYSSIDILYMTYDTTNGSLNNKVALPNKLYEAMYFNVPIITSKETYLGELVEKYGLGITVKCGDSFELAMNIINIDTAKIYKNFSELKESSYLGDSDYKNLRLYIEN